jgi:hypothetical protein
MTLPTPVLKAARWLWRPSTDPVDVWLSRIALAAISLLVLTVLFVEIHYV